MCAFLGNVCVLEGEGSNVCAEGNLCVLRHGRGNVCVVYETILVNVCACKRVMIFVKHLLAWLMKGNCKQVDNNDDGDADGYDADVALHMCAFRASSPCHLASTLAMRSRSSDTWALTWWVLQHQPLARRVHHQCG